MVIVLGVITFFKQADSLSVREDALDVDADGALWRVLTAYDGET